MPHQPKRRVKPTAKCHTSFKKTPNAAVGTVENLEVNRGRERGQKEHPGHRQQVEWANKRTTTHLWCNTHTIIATT